MSPGLKLPECERAIKLSTRTHATKFHISPFIFSHVVGALSDGSKLVDNVIY
jgi:hypothetical protein